MINCSKIHNIAVEYFGVSDHVTVADEHLSPGATGTLTPGHLPQQHNNIQQHWALARVTS